MRDGTTEAPQLETTSARWRWTRYGAAIGVAFPILAVAIRIEQLGAQDAWTALAGDPLLWIIASVPMLLGSFAYLTGGQHDRAQRLSREIGHHIRERAAELHELLARAQLVLDSIGDALVLVTYEGSLAQSPSATARAWFSEREDQDAVAWIFGEDTFAQDTFRAGLKELAGDRLPYALLVERLPRNFRRDGRAYEVRYRRVEAGAAPQSLLLVIRDVTLTLAAAEREGREQQEVVAGMLRDPAGFQRCRQQLEALVTSACETDDALSRKRELHTMQGNALVFGFTTFAEQVHEIERELVTESWNDRHAQRLRTDWQQALKLFSHFGAVLQPGRIQLQAAELDALLREVRNQSATHAIEQQLARWKFTPTQPMLARLAEHARRMTSRLEREVSVVVQDEGTRVDEAVTHEFWQALVHVIRNAVDHGLDTPAEREAAGKAVVPSLRISAEQAGDHVVVRICDDGRGIHWEAIRSKARAAGLPHETTQELTEALFADGITSRAEASELSGRGVGLSALRSACDRLHISVELNTQPGRGTIFTFRLPEANMRPDADSGDGTVARSAG